MIKQTTPFSVVYDIFLTKVTDDMYMEMTKEETEAMLEELLINAIPWFEFPRVNVADYTPSMQVDEGWYQGEDSNGREVRAFIFEGGHFNVPLSQEEVNILATYMVVAWMNQQLANIEHVRMKYSGSDFKFTSQANHLSKVLALKKDYEREGFHLQRLYKRRKIDNDGNVRSTMGTIMKPIDD